MAEVSCAVKVRIVVLGFNLLVSKLVDVANKVVHIVKLFLSLFLSLDYKNIPALKCVKCVQMET